MRKVVPFLLMLTTSYQIHTHLPMEQTENKMIDKLYAYIQSKL